MARQLVFDLPVRTALGREDFFVSPANALALAALDAPEDWPAGKLLLIGPEGSGKSHLAGVWAAARGAAVVTAAALTETGAEELARAGAVVVEDADRRAAFGDADAVARSETALFHLHNLLAAENGLLLVTARSAPSLWQTCLPDLASRLQASAVARLNPPDDTLLAAVLVKLFSDRQLAVPPQLIPWIVERIDRSFASARATVAAIDARALATQRPVSRALALEVLDSRAPGAQ